ncbi:fatty acid elongase [Coprinopsis cinerea okayama7|uniref:Elongation of fatty acids protein n=1 Tax=Coprinopsis cinerea (strain Okayama-7 / 130 / ATCC MYA-4618 / FGSC 9003) TaxID=240176 RepID=A8N1G7_COPC7|nr:fatty acid elongase [Coprinopsis cinerea okayama7\|eukprot:XP_001828716.2 fatty acid elongase [Coprinopsis cinerea okayama7\
MARLADLILSAVPYRLPEHYYVYTPGVTPLSTDAVVVAALVTYLATIFGIQAVMKNQQPLKLTTLFQIHNVILSSGSLLLLVLMLEEIIPIWWNNGFHYALCHENAWTPRLEFYYMVNYCFKYLEFIDTIFLALKKKPLQFLHVFHHSATALLCYTQLNGKTSISWAVIVLNLAVHVVMYYYYYATAGGRRFWWKKYLTTMQIAQFVIDISLVYFGTYEHFAATRWPHLPHIANCSGSEGAALFGCALLTSYLGLFINFYFNTYKKPAQKKSAANGSANGHANGLANGHKKD